MYQFDEKRKILFVSKTGIELKFDGYPESDHYKAYKRYLYDAQDEKNVKATLRGDLNMYADAVSNKLSKDRGIETKVSFIVTKIVEKDSSIDDYDRGTIQTTVYGKYNINGAVSNELALVRLPYVDRFGVIKRKGVNYAIAATSEPSRYITLDKGHILNIMLQALKMVVSGDESLEKMTTEVAKQKVQLITLIYYVSYYMKDRVECPELYSEYKWIDNSYTNDIPEDITSVIKSILTPGNVAWCYKNEDSFELFEVYTNKPAVKNTLDKYMSEVLAMFGLIEHGFTKISKFDASYIRDDLNELLSIDRGYGRKLSRAIYDKDGELLYEVGDVVTNEMLEDFAYNNINCYYVVLTNAIVDNVYLAFPVGLTKIKEGTLIPQALLQYNSHLNIPCNRYGVTAEGVSFDDNQLFVIPENFKLDSRVIDFISSCELCQYMIDLFIEDGIAITTVKESQKLPMSNKAIAVKIKADAKYSVSNVRYIMLEEEIMGNRHFFIDGEWKYVTQDGEVVPAASTLTVYDLIGLMSLMPRVVNGQYLNKMSDRDYGMRKRICLIDDHLHKSWEKCIKRSSDNIVIKFSAMLSALDRKTEESRSLIEDRFCADVTRSLIDKTLVSTRDMRVINIADKTCPPSYVSSLNRVNTITKDKHSASDKMRFLSMGFYGRICPYETPASSKLGLVNTKAVHAYIKDGSIYTEYYRVRNGKIEFSKKIPMTIVEEEQYIIADINSLVYDEDGTILNDDLVLARVPVVNAIEKHIVENVDVKSIQYVNCYPDATLSPTATTIPFIGSDDPVRVSYELSMCKQTRGLFYREIPSVMTEAFYKMVRYNTLFQIVAEDSGVIIDIQQKQHSGKGYAGKIMLYVQYNNLRNVEYNGVNEYAANLFVYEFPAVEYSYNSVIVRYLEVKVGDIVNKDDVLVSSNYTKNGFMATGVDALVAIIPVGYNYEDGVQISEMFDKRLTSFGHSNTEMKLTASQSIEPDTKIRYIDSNATTVCRIRDSKRDKYINYKSDDLKGWLVSIRGVTNKRRYNRDSISKRRLDTVSINTINEGDKIANRHGNKGVTPKVVNNTDMYYLSNGEIIDLAYNPTGIGSRMILGQIKEIHMGLACKVLGIKLCVRSFDEVEWEEMKLLLTYAWECANHGVDTANNDSRFSMYPESLKRVVKENESYIKNWEGVFDEFGRAYISDPRTGKQINTPVVIGYNYVYKLVQEIEEKEHARGSMLSDVPYTTKYAQPTRGARNNGGQSYGYMEQDGLIAHGAVNLLKELKHERGDNVYLRQANAFRLLGTADNVGEDNIEYMEKYNERRSVEYFKALMTALGCKVEVEDEEEGAGLVDTSEYTSGDKFFYSDSVVRGQVAINKEKEEKEKEESIKMVMSAKRYTDDDDE